MKFSASALLAISIISLVHHVACKIRVDPLKKFVYSSVAAGRIRGRVVNTAKGNPGYAFQGVPYAEPPLGQLRYKLPVEKANWTGILNCTEYGPACLSNSSKTTSPQTVVDEDCLTLNIFVGTSCTKDRPCPVVLYIHGGGWSFDAPRMFPVDYIIDNFASTGIVAIFVGFRLGSFGFFTTGDSAASGNYGIHDIIYSLKWIQKEITSLNGDPSKVTLMGHSSAATGVSLLSFSPLSEDLFQQVIPMSGSGVESTALTDAPETNKQFAMQAGCATEDQWTAKEFQPILDCLRKRDAHELLLLQRKLDDEDIMFGGPRIDGPGGIFPESARELAKNRKPHTMMIGTVLREFGPVAQQMQNVTKETLATACSNGAQTRGFKNLAEIGSECVKTYTTLGDTPKEQMAALINDQGSFVPVYEDASSMRDSGANVYLYSFDYVKRGLEGIGPYHAQDLTYVLGIHPFTYDSRDYQIADIYPQLFSNFIKYGDPTAGYNASDGWKPLEKPMGYNYYSVNLPKPTNQPLYHYTGVQFWTVTAPSIDQSLADADDKTTNDVKEGNEGLVHEEPGNPSSVDWETAFWITLVLAVVCLLGLAFLIGIQCCAKRNLQKHYGDLDNPDENTGLLSSSSGNSGNSNNGKKSYI